MICGHEGQLIVEELIIESEEETSTSVGVSAQTPEEMNRKRSRHSSEMQSVLAQLMVIRKQNEELNNEVQGLRTMMTKRIKYLADSVNRLTMVPAKVNRSVNSSTVTKNIFT